MLFNWRNNNCFISIYLIFAIIDIYTRIKGGDFNDGCIL